MTQLSSHTTLEERQTKITNDVLTLQLVMGKEKAINADGDQQHMLLWIYFHRGCKKDLSQACAHTLLVFDSVSNQITIEKER